MTDDPRREQDHIRKNLEEPVGTVVGAMVRGIVLSMPNWPPQSVVNMIAWQVGYHLSDAFNGEIVTLMQLRADLKKSFEEGVAKAAQKMTAPKLVS